MFEKISSPALSDAVASQLLAKIDSGVFARGSKLPTEAVLAQSFGVSRTVVREAISRLKQDGLVDPRQGSGVFVTGQGGIKPLRIDYAEGSAPAAVLHILELRRGIEAEVAALAAERRTAADLRAIEAALKKIARDVKAGGDGVAADVAFHRALALATRNPYFIQTLEFLGQYLETATAVTRRHEAQRDDFSRQVLTEHEAVVAAVRNGDPRAARRAAHTHMANAARRLAAGVDGAVDF